MIPLCQLKFILIVGLTVLSTQTFARVADRESIPATQKDSSLERISTDKGFSIDIPKEWKQSQKVKGVSLFAKETRKSGQRYASNLQVITRKEGVPLDRYSEIKYANLFEDKFSRIYKNLIDYKIQDIEKITLASGKPALAFYATFIMNGIPLQQTHYLTSSSDKHFILTYTKLFEEEGLKPALAGRDKLIMASFDFDGMPPNRYSLLINYVGIVSLLLFVFLAYKLFSVYHWKSKTRSLERNLDQDMVIETEEDIQEEMDSADERWNLGTGMKTRTEQNTCAGGLEFDDTHATIA